MTYQPKNDAEKLVFDTWLSVNAIAEKSENAEEIRTLIANIGIEPEIHVGTPSKDFTPLMTAEWVLGQWAAIIDSGSPWLNAARNISFAQYEKVMGKG